MGSLNGLLRIGSCTIGLRTSQFNRQGGGKSLDCVQKRSRNQGDACLARNCPGTAPRSAAPGLVPPLSAKPNLDGSDRRAQDAEYLLVADSFLSVAEILELQRHREFAPLE